MKNGGSADSGDSTGSDSTVDGVEGGVDIESDVGGDLDASSVHTEEQYSGGFFQNLIHFFLNLFN